MPRDGSNIYHRPAGTDGVPNFPIESSKYNAYVADVEQDLNLPRPIVAGGTGATSADGALDNLSAEKFKQVVTNWDDMVWRAGSFYAATTATGAAPVAGHAFAGIAYYANATDMVLEATDLTDPTSPTKYIRVMSAGVWGAWTGTSGGTVEYTFDSTITFPPAAGQIRFNNATQNSTTEIFISHTTALGVDVTASLPFSLRAGYEILVQDKDEAGKYKTFIATAAPVLSGSDFRITVTFKNGGVDLVSAQRMVLGINNIIPAPAASIGQFTFDSTITFPPNSGQIRFNNATQNSTTEIFISHNTSGGTDVTSTILSSFKSGDGIVVQDTDEPGKYKIFTATSGLVASGGDFRITVTLKSAGIDLVSAQLMLLGVDSGTAVRYDIQQGRTSAEQSQARANINVTKKNYVINGAMQVSQENGTTGVTATNSYPVDMFMMQFTTTGTISAAQVSGTVPGGSLNRLRVTVSTPDTSIAAGEFLQIITRIEGLRVADLRFGFSTAKQTVIQFGVRAPAGTYSVTVANAAGNRTYVSEYIIAAGEANTDVVKSVMVPGDITGTWAVDNTAGIDIRWGLMTGVTWQQTAGIWGTVNAVGSPNQFNFMGTGGNVFELFDVSLTEGTVAPPFQVPDYASELAACQRYYRRAGMGFRGASISSTTAEGTENWPAMRASPSVSLVAGATVAARTPNADFSAASPTLANPLIQVDGMFVQISGFAGMTANLPLFMRGSQPSYLHVNARL